MKNHYLSIIVLLIAGAFLTISCDGQGSKNSGIADYNTVPLPNEITVAEGEPFVLSKSTLVTYPADNEKMQRNAEFLAEFLELSCGIRPAIGARYHRQRKRHERRCFDAAPVRVPVRR